MIRSPALSLYALLLGPAQVRIFCALNSAAVRLLQQAASWLQVGQAQDSERGPAGPAVHVLSVIRFTRARYVDMMVVERSDAFVACSILPGDGLFTELRRV